MNEEGYMLAERTCFRKEDSPEIYVPNQQIQEIAESGGLIKPQFVLFGFLPNLS